MIGCSKLAMTRSVPYRINPHIKSYRDIRPYPAMKPCFETEFSDLGVPAYKIISVISWNDTGYIDLLVIFTQCEAFSQHLIENTSLSFHLIELD